MLTFVAATAAVLLTGGSAAAAAKGPCWSARDCGGKKIGAYTHAHNCFNAGGKSWRSPTDGRCYNN